MDFKTWARSDTNLLILLVLALALPLVTIPTPFLAYPPYYYGAAYVNLGWLSTPLLIVAVLCLLVRR